MSDTNGNCTAILDSSTSDKVQIAVDEREDELFDDFFISYGAKVDRRMLSVGDFICSARLAVERKTRADFEQSIIDGRLFQQLPHLIENYERVVVIVEGVTDSERISREALLGAYGAVIADYGASLIFTKDKEATAEIVFNLAKHEQLVKKGAMRIYAKRKTHTPSQTVRSIVETFPTIGPKIAKAILLHFGTLEKLARATEKEIALVKGVGPKRAKMIKAILEYFYKDEDDNL
ncbi:hypothetical protein HZC07_04820 [Candidatus Micrarchaeota archaeon]|nr:hypothetical protein [Candidatus Micrarchaeota archaeon]